MTGFPPRFFERPLASQAQLAVVVPASGDAEPVPWLAVLVPSSARPRSSGAHQVRYHRCDSDAPETHQAASCRRRSWAPKGWSCCLAAAAAP
jgi:hypothetical protein